MTSLFVQRPTARRSPVLYHRSKAASSVLPRVVSHYGQCLPPVVPADATLIDIEALRPYFGIENLSLAVGDKRAIAAVAEPWLVDLPDQEAVVGVGAMTTGDRKKTTGVRATPRQAQILRLSARGLIDKQIAERLGLSISTVRTQWHRFYKVNRIHNRAAAVALWLRRRTDE